MKNLLILSIFILILLVFSFLISCDDFFSPTIEIFNEIKTPVNTEQDNKDKNIIDDTKINVACLF